MFAVRLAALARWFGLYYWKRLSFNLAESAEGTDRLEAGIMAPACNLLAFAGRTEGLKPPLALLALTLAGLAIAFLPLPG